MIPMISLPNVTIDGDGFHVSYNPVDVAIYGDTTTALVWGQCQHFAILNGNHLDGLRPLLAQGYEACLAYVREHAGDLNMRSDPLDPPEPPATPHPLYAAFFARNQDRDPAS